MKRPTPYFSNSSLDALLLRAGMVLFDMNGLIVDDEPLQLEAMNSVLGPFGVSLSEEYWARYCVGKRSEDFTKKVLSENGIPQSRNMAYDLVKKKNEQYRVLILKDINSAARPGVLELISHLSRVTRQTLALATTASELEVETILGERGLNIKDRFHYIASVSHVTRSKPDPEIYNRLSRLSRTQPADCLVFEDSGPGVLAASRAGMTCIAVPNRFTMRQEFTDAAFIVNDLTRNARVLYNNSRID